MGYYIIFISTLVTFFFFFVLSSHILPFDSANIIIICRCCLSERLNACLAVNVNEYGEKITINMQVDFNRTFLLRIANKYVASFLCVLFCVCCCRRCRICQLSFISGNFCTTYYPAWLLSL